jgi:SAM-dependent methyltransferase
MTYSSFILLVVTALPLCVSSSSFLLRTTTRCIGRANEPSPTPLPFVISSSISTGISARIKTPAASQLLPSSSLNARAGKGFEQQRQRRPPDEKEHLVLSNPDKEVSSSSNNNNNDNIYSKPALYDLAFGFRDYYAQVDFLLAQHVKYSTITTAAKASTTTDDHDLEHGISVLFLGAGPARHALIAVNPDKHSVDRDLYRDDDDEDGDDSRNRRPALPLVASVTCIDNSRDMVQYGKQLAGADADFQQQQEDEGQSFTSSAFRYLLGDMRDFTSLLDKENNNQQSFFDTCWILMGSLQHLTNNTEVLSCFHNVAKSLHAGGTLILELPHPKEELLGGMVDCTRNCWHVPLEDDTDSNNAGQLDILWGDKNDEFDPISQIRKLTVSLELKETPTTASTAPTAKNRKNGKKKKQRSTNSIVVQSVRQVIPIRLFTAQEIDALATCAGFQVVAMSGALEDDISVHDDAAYRLVCILRKL